MHKLSGRQNNGNHSEQQKEKQILKNENSLRNLWNKIKCTNIHIIGVPQGEERKAGARVKNVFNEIMAENFPTLKKETDIQVQVAHMVPNKMNPNRPTTKT